MLKGRKLDSSELINFADGETKLIAVSKIGYEFECVLNYKSVELAEEDVKNDRLDMHLSPTANEISEWGEIMNTFKESISKIIDKQGLSKKQIIDVVNSIYEMVVNNERR
ncbi:hypothetical protein [Clostridium sp.]|uniref:hypothetical protein n=1 Tax=Clostridium sp. TaxID=1506 RepID=UPI003216BD42